MRFIKSVMSPSVRWLRGGGLCPRGTPLDGATGGAKQSRSSHVGSPIGRLDEVERAGSDVYLMAGSRAAARAIDRRR
jgi:hypothetical protein